MDLQPVVHDTFVLERSYPASPERVFSYFSDPAKKRRWFGDAASHDVEAFELDFRVGGVERNRYRMNDKTPFPGTILANEGTIQEIAPGRRVVTATTMTMGDHRISSALITIELVPDSARAQISTAPTKPPSTRARTGRRCARAAGSSSSTSSAARWRTRPVQTATADIDRVFQALGDPTRRAILGRLSQGPQSVSGLAAPLSITLTAVAQHLLVLVESGLARSELVGRVRTCRVDRAGFQEVEGWIAWHRSLWDGRLDRLGELLAEDED